MSDKELIIRLLNEAERRTRRNRILRETAKGLSLAMLVPVLFKAIDLFFPFQVTTVGIFFVLWAIGTGAWLVWRARGPREGLQRIAASIDTQSAGHDQIKTAYWFIRNPQESPWVKAQIERAAENASRLQVNSLYPRQIPRAMYMACGLILLLGLLNFLPLPWNHNWLKLEGAPAFSLSDADRAELQKALELLQKAELLDRTDLADKLEQIIRALQDGSMSKEDLSKSLSQLQQSLAERNLGSGKLLDGLERIARALEPSPLTRPPATEIFKLDLKSAAQEVRNLGKNVDAAPEAALREMADRFQEASEKAGSGLEKISQTMRDTANSMRQRDSAGAKRGLEQTAQELERLQRVLEGDRLRAEASSRLGNVQESAGGTPGEIGQGEGQGQGEGEGEGLGEGDGDGEGDGEGVGTGEGEGQGEGEGVGQGEGEGGEGEGEGEGEGDGDGEGRGNGRGGKRAGLSGPFPQRGDPTSLETQYEKEALPVRPTRGSRPETIEEASQRERSKLDYKNVKSNLSPAQKDALSQDPIPVEKRQFVKEYMESVRQ